MLRKLLRLLLLLTAVSILNAGPMQATGAQPISPKNPFRGLNIGGVNYGSQQWEKQRRGKSPQNLSSRLRAGRPLMRRK